MPLSSPGTTEPGMTRSEPPTLVFPRPRALEQRRLELLEAQVGQLQEEVGQLKAQLLAVVTASREHESSQSESIATSSSTGKRRRVDSPSRPPVSEEGGQMAPDIEPEPADPVSAAVAASGAAHTLVQTSEWRETRSALGLAGRKLRQRSCKVCSVLRGARKRAFETTFYCPECTASRAGGAVFLCDKVRAHDGAQYRGVTCSQIWHVLWDGGKRLPAGGTSIRMRKTLRGADAEPEAATDTDRLQV